MGKIKIESDFKDCYDDLSNNDSETIYKRYRKGGMPRGKALKYLRSLGIKTIELKQVSQFTPIDGEIVVYTDPYAHESKGKQILTFDTAIGNYGNYLASLYHKAEGQLTLKYIQVGNRKFNIIFRKNELLTLKSGDIQYIEERNPGYHDRINLPIFSIDYIEINGEMVATDFNEVENLTKLSLNDKISNEEIIDQIYNILTNKR